MTTPAAASAPCAAPPACAPVTGLRGRKRERTRRAISDAAFRLFAEEGFDAVTLTRIAAEADVAPATVFTHFASKEDIFFGRREEFDAQLWEAVRSGPAGAELLHALRVSFTDACELILGDEEAVAQGRVFSRVLLGSSTLGRSYMHFMQRRQERLLDLLVERAGPRLRAVPGLRAELEIFAALAVAVRQLVFDVLHAKLAEGEPPARIRAAVSDTLDRAAARLARAYEDSDVLDAG
ncbi:helix-turn-helix domain-containing protein [Streptomyces sp. NPDC051173]|uniref:TetR/AcrR family transcriptional regulator n=1 Tax=Streptomyces sp. NPDC051173 TaxID=3155164 RepID=UPI00344CF3A9